MSESPGLMQAGTGMASSADLPLSTLPGNQVAPVAAYNNNADEFMVIWTDDQDSLTGLTIYGQVVSADGTPRGGEFVVAQGIGAAFVTDVAPRIAYNSTDNQYLVIWHVNDGAPRESIYSQLLSSTGERIGGVQAITIHTALRAVKDVAYNSARNEYLVIWMDDQTWPRRVHGLRVSSQGVPIGPEIILPGKAATTVAVAYNEADDEYLVVYCNWLGGTIWDEIRAQRVSGADLSMLGGEIYVTANVPGGQWIPDVAYSADDNKYLVVWENIEDVPNGDRRDVYAQLVAANGTLIGGNFPIVVEAGRQQDPRVAYNAVAGKYLVVWEDHRAAGVSRIYGRFVAGDGAPGDEFIISEASSGQWHPGVASGHTQFLVVWDDNRNGTRDIYGSLVPRSECPLAEVISLRRLDDETLGVVGFVELDEYDGQQIEAATLRAVAGTTVIEAGRDLVALATNSAPGGSPGTIPETAGLWSVALHQPGGFPLAFTLVLETVDNRGAVCQEERTVSLKDPSWWIRTQTVDAPGEVNPADGGIGRIAGGGERPLGEPAAITVQLSRYRPNQASAGLPGTWEVIAERMAPQGCWEWAFTVAAERVEPGENLYRVAAVLSEESGMGDLDGFYAVAGMENLATDEVLQRRQALVFRDTVRTVLANDRDYVFRYPEALIAAIAAQESGRTFDNAIVNYLGYRNGIMQVTCGSGYKGYTETGVNCLTRSASDPPPDYAATRRSIEFNVQDALQVLDEFYNQVVAVARGRPPFGDFIYFVGTEQIDILTTAVVRYNAGPNFIDRYSGPQAGESHYLGAVAGQLSGPVADLLADADYTPEQRTIADLVAQLQEGQRQVNQALGQ